MSRTSTAVLRPVTRRVARAWRLLGLACCAVTLAGVGLALDGCGDTLQDQPIGFSALESVIVKSRFPVYWTGLRFSGMQVTGVIVDPSGAVTIQYGDCLVGGQYTCVVPLSIVTSPDNGFLPVGAATARPTHVRGVAAMAIQQGRTLMLRTGGVVVSVYARSSALATAAATTMVPLNKGGLPRMPLTSPLPDTGFDRQPLRSQVPPGTAIGGR